MTNEKCTPAEAGIGVSEVILIALDCMAERGGEADITDIYAAVEGCMHGKELSEQGQASIREIVGRTAVSRGLVLPFDRHHPGWRITAMGQQHLDQERGKDV